MMNLFRIAIFPLSFFAVIETVFSQKDDICETKRCIQKCCDRDSVMQNRQCVKTNESLTHPFLNGTTVFHIVYNQYCEPYQYRLPAFVEEQLIFHENITVLHYPPFESVAPRFESKDFCVDHIDGKPGALVCINITSVPTEERGYSEYGKLIHLIYVTIKC